MSQIELNKEGVKLSYQRYLSDGVTGLMFISFFVIAYVKKWEMPVVGTSWLTIFPNQVGSEIQIDQISSEIQIVFFIFLFVISPSVGLTLNALSWFFLGTVLVRSIWIWHKLPKIKFWGIPFRFFTEATDRSYNADELLRFFKVDNSIPSGKKTWKKSLYDVSNYYEHLLMIYFPAYFASQMEYVQGSRRLFRSITLMLLGLIIYFGFVHYNPKLMGLCTVLAIFFLLFISLIEYYQAMKMLIMVHSLVMDRVSIKSASPDKNEIARLLSESKVQQSNVILQLNKVL